MNEAIEGLRPDDAVEVSVTIADNGQACVCVKDHGGAKRCYTAPQAHAMAKALVQAGDRAAKVADVLGSGRADVAEVAVAEVVR